MKITAWAVRGKTAQQKTDIPVNAHIGILFLTRNTSPDGLRRQKPTSNKHRRRKPKGKSP